MVTRREYGSGSLYRRKDGIWVGTVEAGWTRSGSRRRVTVSSKDKATAKRKLRDKALELEAGSTTINPRESVKSWAATWLVIVERDLRPSSYNAAASAVRRWIIPTIGHRRLDQVTPADVRAVAEAQRRAELSSSTQLRTHSVLSTMLKAAMLEGHKVQSTVLQVKAPRTAVSDRQAMTTPEAVALLQAAGQLPHASRYVAALLQGMRQAECLGLTWPEVDLERNTLRVSWQLQPLPYKIPRDRDSGFRIPDGYEVRQVKGALHLVRPKSRAGWRVLPLVPWFATALQSWRKTCPPSELGLVWPNLDGSPTLAKDDDAEWYALQGAASVGHPSGRYYSIHEARHTTATLLLEAGIDPTVVIAILGQSALVKSYQHPERTNLAAQALDAVAKKLRLE